MAFSGVSAPNQSPKKRMKRALAPGGLASKLKLLSPTQSRKEGERNESGSGSIAD